LAPTDTLLASLISAPADSGAEFGATAAPFTVKLEPGKVWNTALTLRLLE
jgi:hypothetical protein